MKPGSERITSDKHNGGQLLCSRELLAWFWHSGDRVSLIPWEFPQQNGRFPSHEWNILWLMEYHIISGTSPYYILELIVFVLLFRGQVLPKSHFKATHKAFFGEAERQVYNQAAFKWEMKRQGDGSRGSLFLTAGGPRLSWVAEAPSEWSAAPEFNTLFQCVLCRLQRFSRGGRVGVSRGQGSE